MLLQNGNHRAGKCRQTSHILPQFQERSGQRLDQTRHSPSEHKQ